MRLFYKPKYLKTPPPEEIAAKETKTDPIVQLLLPSFLGIILSAICLAGTTYAWFTASVSTPAVKMEAANFQIQVEVKDGETPVLSVDGGYFLEQGKGYTVTVQAIGTASKGYFKINDSVYPELLAPGQSLTFIFYPESAEKYSFFAFWGNYEKNQPKIIVNNGIVGTPPPTENTTPSETTQPTNGD